MKLIKVKAHNFRSYEDLELDFTKTQGLILVRGNLPQSSEESSNSAGKTTMYTSILYALYGKMPNGDAGNSVVNNKAGRGTYVILEFKQNGHLYRVERYRKHKDNKNKVLLFEDGKDISLPSNKENDKKIVSIVGLNEDTMLNSIVFGSNNMVSFVNATDKQRKEMLEELTGIQIYQKALDLVKEDAKNASESSQVLDKDLQGIISRVESNDALTSQYKASMASYEQTKSGYETKLKNATIDNIDTKALNEQLKSNQKVINDLQAKKQSIQLKDFDNAKLNQVTSTMSSVKYNFNQDKKKMQDLAKQINSIQSSPKSYCQLCGSLLDEDHKQQEINSLIQQGKDTRKDYDSLLQQAPQLKDSYDTLLAQQQQVSEYNDSIVDKQNELQEQINTFIQSNNEIQNKLNNYQSELDNINWLKKQLNNLQVPAKPNIVASDELNKQKKDIEQQQAELEAKQAQLNKLTDVFGLKGVKSHVLGSVLPFVNKRVEHYLDILTEGKFNAFISSKSTTKSGSVNEKMSIDIISQDTGSEYSELSSGEQRRVDLAISLSLQDYLLSKMPDINLLVMDEILDNLDGAGIQAVMKILQEKAKTVDTILVISHNEGLKDNFEKSILVEKVDGISKIK